MRFCLALSARDIDDTVATARPGAIDDGLRDAFVPSLNVRAYARRMPVTPGRFHQQFSCKTVSRLGDTALTPLVAAAYTPDLTVDKATEPNTY